MTRASTLLRSSPKSDEKKRLSHLEISRRLLVGAANSLQKARDRQTLSEPLRELARILKNEVLRLEPEAARLGRKAEDHLADVRVKRSESEHDARQRSVA
ncbi:MAG: hypothetical protein WC876_02030 [Candidatus Thermoplasmatota archaeon]|jgi:hypothetical protein